jgi:hypothetical protein
MIPEKSNIEAYMSRKKLLFAGGLALFVMAGFFLIPVSNPGNSGANLQFFGRACLGPDKSNNEMVLNFVVQGSDIFLDQNKDDIAQPEERLDTNQLPVIEDSVSGTQYQLKELRLTKGVELVSKDLPQCLALTVAVSGENNFEQIGQIFMSTQAEDVKWVHFNGRNRMIFGDPEIALTAGEKIQLTVFFGTNAVGEGRDLGTPKILEADKVQVWEELTETDRFSPVLPASGTVFPELEIEIPTSGEAFVSKISLDEFC